MIFDRTCVLIDQYQARDGDGQKCSLHDEIEQDLSLENGIREKERTNIMFFKATQNLEEDESQYSH